MRALVVYESMYGNTRRIAQAIAEGISRHLAVETIEVSVAPMVIESDVELLVVGGPTHVHGMTTTFTRAQATKQAQAPIVSEGIGLREWLDEVRPIGTSVMACAFDTRIKGAAILTGSAAGGFAKKLRAAGFRVLTPGESFFIATKAPQDEALLEGEVEHARAWGSEIATQLATKVTAPVA
jgi:hypothetical protein